MTLRTQGHRRALCPGSWRIKWF